MSHPTDLNDAQRVLARHLQEMARGQGMTPGAMLAMLRDTVGGPADLKARYGLDDGELEELAEALTRADGFDLIEPAAPFDARGFRPEPAAPPPLPANATARVMRAAHELAAALALLDALGLPVSGPVRVLMDAVAALDDPPETLVERRDRLAAELAEAEKAVAKAEGRHPDVKGEADPERVREIVLGAERNEEIEHDRVVSQRFAPEQRQGGES